MNVFILYLIHWENRPAGGAGARNEVGQAGGTKLAEALGACLRTWNSTRLAMGVPYSLDLSGDRVEPGLEDKAGDKKPVYCSGPDQRG